MQLAVGSEGSIVRLWRRARLPRPDSYGADVLGGTVQTKQACMRLILGATTPKTIGSNGSTLFFSFKWQITGLLRGASLTSRGPLREMRLLGSIGPPHHLFAGRG